MSRDGVMPVLGYIVWYEVQWSGVSHGGIVPVLCYVLWCEVVCCVSLLCGAMWYGVKWCDVSRDGVALVCTVIRCEMV